MSIFIYLSLQAVSRASTNARGHLDEVQDRAWRQMPTTHRAPPPQRTCSRPLRAGAPPIGFRRLPLARAGGAVVAREGGARGPVT